MTKKKKKKKRKTETDREREGARGWGGGGERKTERERERERQRQRQREAKRVPSVAQGCLPAEVPNLGRVDSRDSYVERHLCCSIAVSSRCHISEEEKEEEKEEEEEMALSNFIIIFRIRKFGYSFKKWHNSISILFSVVCLWGKRWKGRLYRNYIKCSEDTKERRETERGRIWGRNSNR